MAIGVYITYRILDVADLTVDGSLATGGAVCALLISLGVSRKIRPKTAGSLISCGFRYSSLYGLTRWADSPPAW